MCLFWWNTDIYLCETSKTIASFSTANWINVPSGCWAGSRAGNCIFCYAAALMVRSILHSSELPAPSLSILKPFLENSHIKQNKKKMPKTPTSQKKKKQKPKTKPKQNNQTQNPKPWLLFCFVFSTNPPLVSPRAVILAVLCPSLNCWRDYPASTQNTDPIRNSCQCLEIFASETFAQVIPPYRASHSAPFSCQTSHRASNSGKKL